ncbi:MAG: hypothetical protein QOF77_1067 [Solirubrobacteraceae bacterium]|jgi:RNA polymerase sigma factor (sigma-70 family)|nr:hypothetical protein [Solirubrobacteraceae bacterium]
MASVIGSAILRTQSDERLVALARTGQQPAFEAIVERYRAELTRSVHRFLPTASVEDVLQQTHLEAWKALSGGTEVRELRAWLHRIARNAAIAGASRGYDYDELKDALAVTPGPDDELERREAVRRALRGVAELPERQREALLAVAVGGRSHAEVGFDLGITDTAARQLVRRARVSLQAFATVATPAPLVLWAARAGHSAVAGAGHTVMAGKAAGAGITGSFTGPALKVGVVAIAVGGVAAGVAPLRQALAPSPPPAAHHHHHARTHRHSVYLAANPRRPKVAPGVSSTAPVTPAATPPAPARHTVHHRRSISANPIGKAVPVAPAASPLPSSAAPTTPATAPATAAAPAPGSLAALIAWAIAHSSQVPGGATAATFTGWTVGQSTPGSTGQTSSSGSSAPGASGQCGPGTPSTTTPNQTSVPGSPGASTNSTPCSASASFPWTYIPQFFSAPAAQKTN